MRHVACQQPECLNKGAPYHDHEPDDTAVNCPVCGTVMQVIPTPEEPVAEPAATIDESTEEAPDA